MKMKVHEDKPKLLYVDDQKENLIVFEAHINEDWEIKTSTSPAEALMMIKEFKPSIILSDMKMGKTNGAEFLKQTIPILPHSVRVIITGYSDEHLLVNAVRYANIFDYIQKPYDVTDLHNRLGKAFEHFKSQEFIHNQIGALNAQLRTEKANNKTLMDVIDRQKKEIIEVKKMHHDLLSSLQGVIDRKSVS
jgi:response regulator RpfG family c-di-GMP phosphodiesterase